MNINEIIKYIDKLDIKTLIAMSIFCILLDILTGYIKAFKNKKLNSSVSRDRIYKKINMANFYFDRTSISIFYKNKFSIVYERRCMLRN